MFFKYLNYVLRHKWYVFLEACKLGVPLRGILHDMSKFRPSEFIPYMKYFYGDYGVKNNCPAKWTVPEVTKVKADFDKAWLLHLKRNPHHYQYWILNKDNGDNQCLEMPKKYILEMIADWTGAGMAITGKNDLIDWFSKNKDKISPRMNTKSFNILLNILEGDTM
ncbi:MAG: DUF5662 family protein [Spirochaetales bacterium]|nr:DUF5662 family protein [Spirochaetales bacterium]